MALCHFVGDVSPSVGVRHLTSRIDFARIRIHNTGELPEDCAEDCAVDRTGPPGGSATNQERSTESTECALGEVHPAEQRPPGEAHHTEQDITTD